MWLHSFIHSFGKKFVILNQIFFSAYGISNWMRFLIGGHKDHYRTWEACSQSQTKTKKYLEAYKTIMIAFSFLYAFFLPLLLCPPPLSPPLLTPPLPPSPNAGGKYLCLSRAIRFREREIKEEKIVDIFFLARQKKSVRDREKDGWIRFLLPTS